ncbi:MAG: hypothetical protein B6D61_08460 [Bacteroidetes bacterium 4484_249]|nr:MAG: hypothetical protein B6D61_08460 [Bacteroidetes bacterium 4484_249]
MYHIQLLILQIVAHLFSDFIFQYDLKAKEKDYLGFKSKFLKWHVLITFGFSWLFSFQLSFIFGALVIALSHWLIDGIKTHLNTNIKLNKYVFFIDQILHLLIIVFVVFLFNKYFEIRPFFNTTFNFKYLLIFTSYLICTKPANIFIKEVFNAFQISFSKDNDLPNAGKLIGITERLLVLTFILLNQFEAVGFLIAAKSILRFKNDDVQKTEYVLIGTMLSFGIAIALGVIVNIV